MSGQSMRGLHNFITEIRNTTSKEAEQKRVDKELAHIRAKFGKPASLDGYDKKKYMWKLIYMYMLGYEVEVGHMMALNLIASKKFSEKNTGYLACSILLNENSELLRLIVQQLKNDLARNDEVVQCLALSCVANLGGQEFAEALASDVAKLLLANKSGPFVAKKAALCLLRLVRKFPDAIPGEEFPQRLMLLLDDNDIGILLSLSNLLLALVANNAKLYEGELPTRCVNLLTKLVFWPADKRSDYKYYHTVCPWLQVRLLRLLQYFPPPADKNILQRLNHVLNEILTKTQVTRSVNKNNADHGVLFEAVNLIIHNCQNGSTELHGVAIGILGKFISVREPNIRYLGLETMSRMAAIPDTLPSVKRHLATIQISLKDADISIRKRALDLLYVMCDKTNAQPIVQELIKFLQKSDFAIREELVLKIAILAERFATDLKWYVDVVLQLISMAGDFVSDDIWYRVVQIVTNNSNLQEYAAITCYKYLANPAVHEAGVKVGGYILGEFGHLITDQTVTGEKQFDILEARFKTASNPTKAMLLSAFIKLANTYAELKPRADAIFQRHNTYVDTEIQQRANEYFLMNNYKNEDVMTTVLEVMPNFPERESALIKRVRKSAKSLVDNKSAAAAAPGSNTTKANGKEGDSDDEKDKKNGATEAAPGGPKAEGKSAAAPAAAHTAVGNILSIPGGSGSGSGHAGGAGPAGDDSEDEHEGKEAEKGGDSDQEGGDEAAGGGESGPRNAVDLFPAQDKDKLAGLYGKPQGTLYEAKGLSILIKLISDPGQCKMVLYYNNRTGAALTNVQAAIVDNPALRIQVRPDKPFDVKPQEQVLHLFIWECSRPFTDLPTLKITFTYDEAPQSLTFRMPVTLASFLQPTPANLDAAAFATLWKQYAPTEVLQTLKSATPVTVAALRDGVVNGLHLLPVAGVDANPLFLFAAGTFHTCTKGKDGNPLTMPVFVRFETKDGVQAFRVTVHSGHRSVSDALLQAISTVFAAPPLNSKAGASAASPTTAAAAKK